MLSPPIIIEPNAIYREGDLALALDMRRSALCRARREGRLRFRREGQAVLILGQWVLDWMTGQQREAASHA